MEASENVKRRNNENIVRDEETLVNLTNNSNSNLEGNNDTINPNNKFNEFQFKEIQLSSPINIKNKEMSKFNSEKTFTKSRNFFDKKANSINNLSHLTINNLYFNRNKCTNLKSFFPTYSRLIFLNKSRKNNKGVMTEKIILNQNSSNKQKKLKNNNKNITIPKEVLVKNYPLSNNTTLKKLESEIRIPNFKAKSFYPILPSILSKNNSKEKDNKNSKDNSIENYYDTCIHKKSNSIFSKSYNIKRMKLKSLFSEGTNQQQNIYPLNTINNELPKTNENIKLGSKYFEGVKAPDVDERNIFNEKVKTLKEEDRKRKRRKNKIHIPNNGREYLNLLKNKKLAFYRDLVEKTVENASKTKNKLTKLFDDIRKNCNQFDNWNKKENEDNLFDK